ncbi:MAG TPA: hypothetical protein VNR17_03815 [Luteimicrobium sp.]|jgi:hypothetical protein|nr:hypothetical protein [Luteimicrobium sp.]
MTTECTTTATTFPVGAVHTTVPGARRRLATVTLDPVGSEQGGVAHHDERVVFTGQVDGADPRARVWVRVDDGPWMPADRVVLGEWVYETPGTLRAGRHAVHVRATDTAGVPLASTAHEFPVASRRTARA